MVPKAAGRDRSTAQFAQFVDGEPRRDRHLALAGTVDACDHGVVADHAMRDSVGDPTRDITLRVYMGIKLRAIRFS